MQRITTATRALNKFGAGKDGFTDGDVVGGIPATDLEAALFDNIQEEIANVIETAGIALNGAVKTQLLAAIKVVALGRLLNTQVFNTSGTYTPTAGTKRIRVREMGGGAGGASTATTTAGQVVICGGGGSGAYSEAVYDISTLTLPATVTVGAGGAAGGGGGTTSFGAYLTAPGGISGAALFGTTSNQVIAAGGGGGSVGTVSGSPLYSIRNGGTSAQAGFAINGTLLSGGGTPGFPGVGAPGGSAGGAGAPGLSPGSGGSGAAGGPSTGPLAGGAGSAGIVIIEEFA